MMSHRWWVKLEIMLGIRFESFWISFYWLQYCQNVAVIYSAHLFYGFSRNKSQFIHIFIPASSKGCWLNLKGKVFFMHLLSPIFSPWKIQQITTFYRLPPSFSNDSLGLVIPPVIFVTANMAFSSAKKARTCDASLRLSWWTRVRQWVEEV